MPTSLPPFTAAKETIGQKMRRLRALANASNPLINPPLNPAVAWVSSTSYIKSQVVSNGGSLYICQVGGTSASSGGPSGTTGYITDGTAKWYFYGLPQTTVASVNAPAITYSGTNTGITFSPWGPSSITLNGNYGNGKYGVYNFLGGVPLVAGTSSQVNTYWTNNGGQTYGWAGMRGATIAAGTPPTRNGPIGSKVEFWTDAVQMSFNISTNYDAGSVLINDSYVQLGTLPSSATGSTVSLDFSNAGGREARRITLELPSTSGIFTALQPGPNSSVWATPASDIVRAIWVGDSIFAGSTYHPSQQASDIPNLVSKRLGWRDSWNMSVGGTGWVTTGTALNFLSRIPYDVTPWAPDVVLLQSSQNDQGVSSASITSNIVSGIGLIRAASPTVPIIVLGQWASNTGPSANCIAAENAALAAVTQLNDPRIWFIPVSTDASGNGPWVFGTGYTGATNNSGNSDVLVAPDGAHPTWLGCNVYARMLAARINNVISLIP